MVWVVFVMDHSTFLTQIMGHLQSLSSTVSLLQSNTSSVLPRFHLAALFILNIKVSKIFRVQIKILPHGLRLFFFLPVPAQAILGHFCHKNLAAMYILNCPLSSLFSMSFMVVLLFCCWFRRLPLTA